MGFLQHSVVVMVLLICSKNASSTEENSTDIQSIALDIHKAHEEFIKISRHPQDECTEVHSNPNEFIANEIMDMLLEFIRNLIREKNMDRMPIPKFEETFTKKVGIVTMKGTFKGDNGWIESTTSITRKNDAFLYLNGCSVRLDSTLGLNNLRLGMEFSAKLSFLRVNGNLQADVLGNAVAFSGGLLFNSGKCRFFLSTLKVEELGKIVVRVTDLGKLNWLYSKIATWVTARLKDKIKDVVENKIKDVIIKELEKRHCPIALL